MPFWQIGKNDVFHYTVSPPNFKDTELMAKVDTKLLEILVCPITKTHLEHDNENNELISRAAGVAYPIRDGIPIMLIDEARIIDQEKADQFKDLIT